MRINYRNTVFAGLLVCHLAGQAPPQPTRVRPALPTAPPRIVSFTAQPDSVPAGQQVLLTWATENPNGAVSVEPGLGRVTARGTRQVSPAVTTTYTLKIGSGDNPDLIRSVTVAVTGTAPNQPTAAQTELKPLLRMPDGKPDLSGVYGFAGIRGATPPTLKPGAEKYRIVRTANDVRGTTTLGTDCKPLGVPQSFATPYPFQIVQRPNLLVMIFEYPNAIRMIPLDGRPPPVDPDPTWMGSSVGRWDGDTLVVDTVGFNDKTEVNGFLHTEALHVLERFRRLDNGNLQYDVTVDDPNVFAAPWVMPARTFPLRSELETVDEFVCENNPDYEKLFKK